MSPQLLMRTTLIQSTVYGRDFERNGLLCMMRQSVNDHYFSVSTHLLAVVFQELLIDHGTWRAESSPEKELIW